MPQTIPNSNFDQSLFIECIDCHGNHTMGKQLFSALMIQLTFGVFIIR